MLYLLPAYLSENSPADYFAPTIKDIIMNVDHYFVENEKTARKVIKFFAPEKKQPDLKLFLLDKYSETSDLKEAQKLMKEGVDFGLLSEAGLPCIGDPGNIMVGWSHKNNIKVIPVNGPSSFVLALIASGFNGQQFSFNGYLAIEKDKKKKEIQHLRFFVSHGSEDAVIPLDWGRKAADFLYELGAFFTFREYMTGHSVNQKNYIDLIHFFEK